MLSPPDNQRPKILPYVASDLEEVKHQEIELEFSINQKASPDQEGKEYDDLKLLEKPQPQNVNDIIYSDSDCNLSSVMTETLPEVNTIRSKDQNASHRSHSDNVSNTLLKKIEKNVRA